MQWSRGTVKMILTNPVYMGCLVQGRTCGKDYMMRSRHDIDSGDWSVKEHTHEAIISVDMFFEAAGKFEKSSVCYNKKGYSKTVPVEEDIFANVLFCGDCGSKMKRITAIKQFSSKDRVRTYSYNCPKTDRIDEQKCITKIITIKSLTDIVMEAIRREFSLSAMRPKELVESNDREAERIKKEWNRQLLVIEKKIENIKKLGSEQYLKYRMGELDEESFRQEKKDNDKATASLQKKSTAIAERLKNIDFETVQKNHFLRTLIKGDEKTELTSEVVRTLIHRIEVYPDQRVKVIFAFKRNTLRVYQDAMQQERGNGVQLGKESI